MTIEIKKIEAKDTYLIRHQVMWPNKELDYIKLSNDDEGFHFGAYVDHQCVSVVSLFIKHKEAQFRKFATLEKYQNKGIGSQLLQYLINQHCELDFDVLWCNARCEKTTFYEKFGFVETSFIFEKDEQVYQKMIMRLNEYRVNSIFFYSLSARKINKLYKIVKLADRIYNRIMKYLSVKEISLKWKISERSVRNYCHQNRVEGALLKGKIWFIPEQAKKPKHIGSKSKNDLLDALKFEKETSIKGRIYHKFQIEFTYNSNHIEGLKLSHDETRYIFETKTIGLQNKIVRVDDIIETVNHFNCIDYVIDRVNYKLSERFIKELHRLLKSGTSDENLVYVNIGDNKLLANEVGGQETASPEEVAYKMNLLLKQYHQANSHNFDEILDFHVQFEKIHPFQDGNGRVGRLIMMKECLKNNIVPFMISDDTKLFYYRGLKMWKDEKGLLLDTCLSEQDKVKSYLDYFGIKYDLT